MTETANIESANGMDTEAGRSVIHPLYVRITHWINALAMLIMIGSGWQIYNASPLFNFTFPRNSLGGWLAGGLLWHFAAMWLLVANGLVYVILGLVPAGSGASFCRSGHAKLREILPPHSPGGSVTPISPATTPCRR